MTETEEVARAIYEGRNGRGCTPWARLPAEHKGPYLADAMAAMRVILESQYPGRGGQWLDERERQESIPREAAQWTPAELARFRAENSPPFIPNRLGKRADAK